MSKAIPYKNLFVVDGNHDRVIDINNPNDLVLNQNRLPLSSTQVAKYHPELLQKHKVIEFNSAQGLSQNPGIKLGYSDSTLLYRTVTPTNKIQSLRGPLVGLTIVLSAGAFLGWISRDPETEEISHDHFIKPLNPAETEVPDGDHDHSFTIYAEWTTQPRGHENLPPAEEPLPTQLPDLDDDVEIADEEIQGEDPRDKITDVTEANLEEMFELAPASGRIKYILLKLALKNGEEVYRFRIAEIGEEYEDVQHIDLATYGLDIDPHDIRKKEVVSAGDVQFEDLGERKIGIDGTSRAFPSNDTKLHEASRILYEEFGLTAYY